MRLRHLAPWLVLVVAAAACGSSDADDAEEDGALAATDTTTVEAATDTTQASADGEQQASAPSDDDAPDFDRASEPEALALIDLARNGCGGFLGAVAGEVAVTLDLTTLGGTFGEDALSVTVPFAIDVDGDAEVSVTSDSVATPDGDGDADIGEFTVRWISSGDYFVQPSDDELAEQGHAPGTWFTAPESLAELGSAPLELRESFCGEGGPAEPASERDGVLAQLNGAIIGGTETIRGTPTTRVDGFLPLAGLNVQPADSDDSGVDLLGTFLSMGGSTPLNLSVWIDAQGNAHRWQFTHTNFADTLVSLMTDTDDASLDVNVTAELRSFNDVADIVAPPPDTVAQLPDDAFSVDT